MLDRFVHLYRENLITTSLRKNTKLEKPGGMTDALQKRPPWKLSNLLRRMQEPDYASSFIYHHQVGQKYRPINITYLERISEIYSVDPNALIGEIRQIHYMTNQQRNSKMRY